MSAGVGRLVCALTAALVLSAASTAAAAPVGPLSHQGRWITDAHGRVVILHGVNMVYKRPPYYPAASGFGPDDARFLAENGFDTVRLGLIYKGVEPRPGSYDDAYLSRIADTEQALAQHGIFSLLDFHQDLYNERFGGEGWPDWAVQDDGLPALPNVGFPGNYLVMPALNRAFDHFWANDPGPGGVGLQDRYVAALGHVATALDGSDHVLGYDLLNEPWPGTVYPTCLLPVIGCPLFDTGALSSFTDKAIAAIRGAGASKLTFYEPAVTFDFGLPTSLPATGDREAAMSFHDYCLPGSLGLPTDLPCSILENLPFQNADSHSQATGDAQLLTEFGATDDLPTIERVIDDADRHMTGWQYWHYCECADPTTSGTGTQGVVVDPNQPPAGSNVKEAKLAVLSRPYPQAIAGTPESYGFDPTTDRFQLAYSTSGPDGRAFDRSEQTEIYVGHLHYPDGYRAAIQGGRAVSAANAGVLRIRARAGAARVIVVVTPA